MCKKKIHEILEESEKLKENLEQIRNFLETGLKDQSQRQNFIDLFDAQTRLERLRIEAEKARNRQWHITANIIICSFFCCVAVIVTYLITKDNSNLIHYIHEYVFRGI